MYKALRDARIRRRKAKEENELLREMYEFFQTQQAQTFRNQISKIQGNSKKLYETQKARTYVPRQLSNLTITNHVDTAYKPFENLLKDFRAGKD